MVKHFFFIAFLISSSLSYAQTVTLVEEIFQVLELEELHNLSVEEHFSSFSRPLPKLYENDSTLSYLYQEQNKELLAISEKYLSWEAKKPFLVEIWLETYSRKELEAYLAFVSSPEGASFAQKEPVPNAQIAAEMKAFGDEYLQASEKTLEKYSEAIDEHLEYLQHNNESL